MGCHIYGTGTIHRATSGAEKNEGKNPPTCGNRRLVVVVDVAEKNKSTTSEAFMGRLLVKLIACKMCTNLIL